MARRTKEQKQQWREQMNALVAKVRAMDDEERMELMARLGSVVTAEGRTLSVNNTVLLYMQNERPVVAVGGFRQWQGIGRQVRKGEKASYIYVPIGGPKEKEGEQDEDEQKKMRFRLVPVFAERQTDLIEAEAVAP